jgi:streptogramin lyase
MESMNTVVKPCRVLATALAASCMTVVAVATARAASDTITEFGLSKTSGPTDLVAGADGNVWFLDDGSTPAIGRITPNSVITEFSAGLNPGSSPGDIVRGPDGNVWFDNQGRRVRLGASPPAA